MKKLVLLKVLFPVFLILVGFAAVNSTIDDFFMPGSQPDAARSFDAPVNCATCHSGINNNSDISYEPTFGWQGSMMSQAMRDPLYLASLAIANQDADFAGDLCLRCHTPSGWLSGRSEPTDGSALTPQDIEGIDCHFCHELINPESTDVDDLVIINALAAEGNRPPQAGNGMFVMESDNKKRHGPFDDAEPKSHTSKFDTFYSESAYCGTCHDVSNPVFKKTSEFDENGSFKYVLDLGNDAKTFLTHDMFPVERTYSEWTMSAYNSTEGISSSVFGGNKTTVSSCQDCHMKDVTGYGCNKNNIPLRSDLPMHDLTGGNTFVPTLLAQLYPEYADELNAGIARAEGMLQNAATMEVTGDAEEDGYEISVKIINESGHKLPSGYPEGRRIWIQVIAYDIGNNPIWYSGEYDQNTGDLSKTDSDGNDTKIYEAKLAMSDEVESATGKRNTADGSSFHFALNNKVVKDNRIPPRGFTNENFKTIQSPVIGYSYDDGEYWDITEYHLPLNTDRVEVRLLYQTTSKEYIAFLRDENSTTTDGQTMYDLWSANGKSTPEVIASEEGFYVSSLGVLEQTNNGVFLIYPNPTKDVLYIDLSNEINEYIELEIYNSLGQKIRTIHKGELNSTNRKIEINLESMETGIYIFKLKTKERTVSKMISIK